MVWWCYNVKYGHQKWQNMVVLSHFREPCCIPWHHTTNVLQGHSQLHASTYISTSFLITRLIAWSAKNTNHCWILNTNEEVMHKHFAACSWVTTKLYLYLWYRCVLKYNVKYCIVKIYRLKYKQKYVAQRVHEYVIYLVLRQHLGCSGCFPQVSSLSRVFGRLFPRMRRRSRDNISPHVSNHIMHTQFPRLHSHQRLVHKPAQHQVRTFRSRAVRAARVARVPNFHGYLLTHPNQQTCYISKHRLVSRRRKTVVTNSQLTLNVGILVQRLHCIQPYLSVFDFFFVEQRSSN